MPPASFSGSVNHLCLRQSLPGCGNIPPPQVPRRLQRLSLRLDPLGCAAPTGRCRPRTVVCSPLQLVMFCGMHLIPSRQCLATAIYLPRNIPNQANLILKLNAFTEYTAYCIEDRTSCTQRIGGLVSPQELHHIFPLRKVHAHHCSLQWPMAVAISLTSSVVEGCSSCLLPQRHQPGSSSHCLEAPVLSLHPFALSSPVVHALV